MNFNTGVFYFLTAASFLYTCYTVSFCAHGVYDSDRTYGGEGGKRLDESTQGDSESPVPIIPCLTDEDENRNQTLKIIKSMSGEIIAHYNDPIVPRALYRELRNHLFDWSDATGYFQLLINGDILHPLDDKTNLEGGNNSHVQVHVIIYDEDQLYFIRNVYHQRDLLVRFKEYCTNYFTVMAAVKVNGLALQFFDEKFQDDKEIVKAAVMQNGNAVKYASDELKRSVDIVDAAFFQTYTALEYVSDIFTNDKLFMQRAVNIVPYSLNYASKNLQQDDELIMVAVKHNPNKLNRYCMELRKNIKLILPILAKRGYELDAVPKELKKNREIVLIAVKNDGEALRFVDGFNDDEEVVLEAIKSSELAFMFSSIRMKENRKVALAAVKKEGCSLQHAKKFIFDRDIVLAAVRNNGYALQFASQELRNDFEIVKDAVEENGLALLYASESLRNDMSIIKRALKSNERAIMFVPSELKSHAIAAMNSST